MNSSGQPPLPNLHASLVVVGDRGVLLRGASGSGKTTLALALLAAGKGAGRFASFVADDQLLVEARGGRLLGRAPQHIGGLVETRGRLPQPVAFEPAATVDLVVALVDSASAPRCEEDQFEVIGGCRLPLLVLPHRNVAGSLAAVLSWLSLHPFVVEMRS